MPRLLGSSHRGSTCLRAALLPALVVVVCGCNQKEATVASAAAEDHTQTAGRKETPRQRSYRLLPRIERGSSTEFAVAPLTALDPKLGVGLGLVLRRPGANRQPTEAELGGILELGSPLPTILHRNLLRQMATHRPKLTAISALKPGGLRAFLLEIEFPGDEAFVLLPEFWEYLSGMLREPPCVAIPNRNTFWILPRRRAKFLAGLAPRLEVLHRQGGDPLFDRFIWLSDDGKLVGGPRFATLVPR